MIPYANVTATMMQKNEDESAIRIKPNKRLQLIIID